MPCLAKMFAIGGAIDGVFALFAAALRADLTADAGTMTACAPLFADLAKGIHDRVPGVVEPLLDKCLTVFVPIVTSKSLWQELVARSASYDQRMARTDLYVKVELDHEDEENVERLASEICRMIRRVYGVRNAEVSSIVERDK